jgi:hypothetical protein
MSILTDEARLLSLATGRMRIHLPGWVDQERDQVEKLTRRLPGVLAVQANAVTGNVLIHFDPKAVDPMALWRMARNTWEDAAAQLQQSRQSGGSSVGGGPPPATLLRVGVQGLFGHMLVDALWFTAGFVGQSLGLPLAGLGPLHLLLDVAVWGRALKSAGAAA